MSDIAFRTVTSFHYEAPGKKGKFTILAVMVMDAAGDMMHVTENMFGTEVQRAQLVKQRQEFWCPGGKPAVFRLKNMRKVQKQAPVHLSCTTGHSLVVENFCTPKSTIKAVAVMAGSIEDKVLPVYYLPRRIPLCEVEQVQEGLFVTVCGLLSSASGVEETPAGRVRSLAIHDETMVLDGIKVWHENGLSDLGASLRPEDCMIVLSNFWIGINPQTQQVAKIVNVAGRSGIRVLQRAELLGQDAAWYDALKGAKPQKVLNLDDGDFSQKSRRSMAEWAAERAEQTSAAMLSVLSKPMADEKSDAAPVLYRLDGVYPQADLVSDWKTKKGELFPVLMLTDASGQVRCRCPEEPLLELLGLPALATGEAQRIMESGHPLFRRASMYVQRTVQADRDDPAELRVNLVVKAAAAKWFVEEPLPSHLLMHYAGLYPCSLLQLEKPGFGGMRVGNVSVSMPLVLLQGSMLPPRSQIDGQQVCSIKNVGCKCLAKTEDAEALEVDVVAKVPLEVQTQYVLEPQQPCLVVVGGRDVEQT